MASVPLILSMPVILKIMAAAAAAAAVAATVLDGITNCGVAAALAQRVATDLFSDSFEMVKDKTVKELDEDLKAYADLPANGGRIRFAPAIRTALKAFIYWVQHEYRMSRDPTDMAFPAGDIANIMKRARTQQRFIENKKLMADAAKPKEFTAETKWSEWEPTLVGYLRALPGRDGVPLSYIIRRNDDPDPTPRTDFLDEYVANAPFDGEAYNVDNVEVATLIKSFLVGNTEAETKIQTLDDPTNGRAVYQTLHETYAGQGIFAIDLAEAESYIENLYYNGEKRPYMWWARFEQKLKWAYAVIDREEGQGRPVYSDARKIKKLLEKRIKADFLAETKATLMVQLAQVPMRLTFIQTLAALRASVQAVHPEAFSNEAHTRTVTRRQINAVTRAPGRGRGFGGRGRGGRGRGRGGGRGYHNHDPKRTRSDSEIVTLNNGKRIEYHPSFRFPNDVISQFPAGLYDRMKSERQAYKKRRVETNASVQETRSQAQDIAAAIISEISSRGGNNNATTPPQQVNTDNQTQVSQVTTGQGGATMFGGRNSRVQHN